MTNAPKHPTRTRKVKAASSKRRFYEALAAFLKATNFPPRHADAVADAAKRLK